MKLLSYLLVLLLATFIGTNELTYHSVSQSVNAILGDISYETRYGESPEATTPDQNRIQAHLTFVEKYLRQLPHSSLTSSQKEKREAMLDHLHTYALNGQFPSNYDYPDERKPCFIDRRGNICAVGYLVEQSVGREVAEKINSRYQYEKVMDMELEALDQWAEEHGFEKEELAMIQPTYAPIYAPDEIPTGDGLYTAVFGGIGLASSAISLTQMNQAGSARLFPWLGIATGGLNTLGGIYMVRNYKDRFQTIGNPYGNIASKHLGMLNIGMGTFAMAVNSYALIRRRQMKNSVSSLQFQTYPLLGQSRGWGVGLSKRF